jgi:hypothetical protein
LRSYNPSGERMAVISGKTLAHLLSYFPFLFSLGFL